ncbi:MAG TPA: alpha-ketoacid dehydrogenase subunit beta [Candidatus Binatia bacterium]|nr:alpha-ketoacid dehydrogenase subunit beta [Candidatus Binatia bacterium]
MAERSLLFVQAINEALHQAMAADPTVVVMGEDVAGGGGREAQGISDAWGGIMGATRGLIGRYGAARVIDTPISEMGFLGMAVGAAATGLRPVAELMFMDFIGSCLDMLLNQAAKMRYMFGGKTRVPLVVRTLVGAGLRAAAQHSQSLHGMTTAIPGLKTVIPSNPRDAKGLLLAAIADDDPVIFCEPKTLYFTSADVPEEPYTVPIGKAAIARPGTAITIVGAGKTVEASLAAATTLAAEGVDAEVVDLRSLSPLDEDAILGSLGKTGYLVVADEAPPRCGLAADVVALAVDRGFDLLRGPVKRVTAPHTPVPFSPVLEDAYLVGPDRIVAAAHAALES